jgi:hypothetical protein
MSNENTAVDTYVRRLNGNAWGISLGMLFGLGLFLATLALVLRGGEDVGAHLGLLSVYFPYYDVTVPGSFLGFGYAFVVGYVTGRVLCFVYNATSRK